MRSLILVLAVAVMGTGCAPQFIDVPPPKKKSMWVERDAILTHGAIGESQQSEVVLSDVTKDLRLSAEERVIWLSGVDLGTTKLQRSHERIDSVSSENNQSRIAKRNSIVEIQSFNVVGSSISASGQLALQKFKTNEMARYYVEFLNDGPMTEEKVNDMMQAWKELALRLKDRGLNSTNVILGGAKYDQAANAIVLVKVGK